MITFPHPDLIPSKFTHRFTPMNGAHILSIDHSVNGEIVCGVDVNIREKDLLLTNDEFHDRIIAPCVRALEVEIDNG